MPKVLQEERVLMPMLFMSGIMADREITGKHTHVNRNNIKQNQQVTPIAACNDNRPEVHDETLTDTSVYYNDEEIRLPLPRPTLD